MLTLVTPNGSGKINTQADESVTTATCTRNILTYLENKEKEIKSIARRELVQIQNSKDVSEGKKRLYDKAAKAFQVFIDAEDVREETHEQQTITYYILLYYIDKFFSDVDVELDDTDKVLLLGTLTDKRLAILLYLLENWLDLAQYQFVTIYELMLTLFSDS